MAAAGVEPGLAAVDVDKQLTGLTPDKQQFTLFRWLDALATQIPTLESVRPLPILAAC